MIWHYTKLTALCSVCYGISHYANNCPVTRYGGGSGWKFVQCDILAVSLKDISASDLHLTSRGWTSWQISSRTTQPILSKITYFQTGQAVVRYINSCSKPVKIYVVPGFKSLVCWTRSNQVHELAALTGYLPTYCLQCCTVWIFFLRSSNNSSSKALIRSE
jgi:hypothetical protein